MSSLPKGSLPRMQPDAWPPTSGRNTPMLDDDTLTDDDDLDLPLLSRNPLQYFLTPPTPNEEDMDFQFDFDAGIEDVNKPQKIVRSISPSTLDGLKKYKPHGRGNGNDCAILDDDSDDEEDYIRFRPSKSFPLGLPDFGFDRPKSAGSMMAGRNDNNDCSSTTSFHIGSPRGRPEKKFSPPRRTFQGRSRNVLLQRRHSYREPSPDVWSIEEEPEKETLSERGLSTEDLEAYFHEEKTPPMDIPTLKTTKKVRFVLPGRDSYH